MLATSLGGSPLGPRGRARLPHLHAVAMKTTSSGRKPLSCGGKDMYSFMWRTACADTAELDAVAQDHFTENRIDLLVNILLSLPHPMQMPSVGLSTLRMHIESQPNLLSFVNFTVLQ